MIPAIGIGPLGLSEWGVGGISGLSSAAANPAGTAAPAGSGSFANALSSAIGSLDGTQSAADAAAQGLATGTVSDPTQAVTAVENAALSMDYAAEIRNQLTSAATTLFSTQL